MKAIDWTKRILLSGTLLIAAAATAAQAQAPAETPPAAPAPAPAGEPYVIATINNVPVNAQWFHQMLMSVGGSRVLQHAIDLMVVEQEASKNGTPMQGPDFEKLVQAEIDRTLDALEAQGIRKEDRTRVFFQLLQRSGRTEDEFLVQMRIQAGLRMLSAGRVEAPTEKEIQDAFNALYGPRVEGRTITMRTRAEITTIRKRLENGEAFEAVMQSTPNIVRLQAQTIAESTTYEREADKQLKAAALATKEGTLSPVVQDISSGGELFYAVFVDKIVPKDPTASLADPVVRARIERIVKNSKDQRWMSAKAAELHQNLQINIRDPILSRQYQIAKELQQAANAPAQPAPAPAPAP
ncbi:MAG: hypothetical protein FWD53_13615 [Phycisphaerales bacterium]|nr:hypothetical protein [Phycisphaerales bacterium]